MTLFVFIAWVVMHGLVLNIGIKAGWGYDPGFIGPILIMLIVNTTLALYVSNSKK